LRITRIDHVQLAMPAGGEDLARAFYGGALGRCPGNTAGSLAAWPFSGPYRRGDDQSYMQASLCAPHSGPCIASHYWVHGGIGKTCVNCVEVLAIACINRGFGRIAFAQQRLNLKR
jgi:hypothetical protein